MENSTFLLPICWRANCSVCATVSFSPPCRIAEPWGARKSAGHSALFNAPNLLPQVVKNFAVRMLLGKILADNLNGAGNACKRIANSCATPAASSPMVAKCSACTISVSCTRWQWSQKSANSW